MELLDGPEGVLSAAIFDEGKAPGVTPVVVRQIDALHPPYSAEQVLQVALLDIFRKVRDFQGVLLLLLWIEALALALALAVATFLATSPIGRLVWLRRPLGASA